MDETIKQYLKKYDQLLNEPGSVVHHDMVAAILVLVDTIKDLQIIIKEPIVVEKEAP